MVFKMLTILFALAIIATVFTHANIAEARIIDWVTKGLVSYWTFDSAHITGKTVKDVEGNNNGAIVGNPQIVEGKIGQALSFDGNDIVNMGNPEELNFGEEDYSIEAWIKTKESDVPIITKMQSSNERGWQNKVLEDGKFYNRIQVNNGNDTETTSAVNDLNWHHTVTVISRTGGRQILYIDGKSEANENIADVVGSVTNERDVIVGSYHDGKKFFSGAIDEVRIYNRALSDGEIEQNYKSEGFSAIKPAGKLSLTWGEIKAPK